MYPELKTDKKTGQEQFHSSSISLNFDVLSFWQWSASNLAANNLRGHLAEYLVTKALGLDSGIRSEWDSCDIRTPSGLRIEIKSAAYIQTWHQKALSKIIFNIAPALGWDSVTKQNTTTKQRNSDVYIFCLHKHQDQNTFDPTDLSQWEFYILATDIMNNKLGDQKTLSLNVLLSLSPIKCDFDNIQSTLINLGHQI